MENLGKRVNERTVRSNFVFNQYRPGNDQTSIIIRHDAIITVEENEEKARDDTVDKGQNVEKRAEIADRRGTEMFRCWKNSNGKVFLLIIDEKKSKMSVERTFLMELHIGRTDD